MMTAAKQTRILIRCDAGRQLGSGHVMRCLTLAHALVSRGASITFACSAETFETVPTLAASGFPAITLDAPLEVAELVATGQHWDAMVVDHYQLDARHEAGLRRAAPVILVLDDLADRPHDCDILVDQTVGRKPSDYAALAGLGTDLLLGADYALLRPEFARARPAALAARARARPVSRIFVSLGMTDIGGITAPVVEAVLAAGLEAEIVVAVGSRARSLPDLRALAAADRRVVLHLDCTDICGPMAASDLAIGGGGTTSWERCCLGLPTIMLVLAENQTTIARNLARLGAVELVPERDSAALGAALRRLAGDPAARVAMSAAAGAVTDGGGVETVVQSLLKRVAVNEALKGHDSRTGLALDGFPRLVARIAQAGDSEEIWRQRNDLSTRGNARNTGPISWSDHADWFARALGDQDRMICMVEACDLTGEIGRGMAVVRFDPSPDLERCWIVSISLAPAFRGFHLARPALRAACRFFFRQYGTATLEAEIRPSNPASARIFAALGFQRSGSPRGAGFDSFIRPCVGMD